MAKSSSVELTKPPTMQMATGRASGDEVARMIGEKVEAALTLQAQAMTGRATPATAVRHYRRRFRRTAGG